MIYYSQEWVEIYVPHLKDKQKVEYIENLLLVGDVFSYSYDPIQRIYILPPNLQETPNDNT